MRHNPKMQIATAAIIIFSLGFASIVMAKRVPTQKSIPAKSSQSAKQKKGSSLLTNQNPKQLPPCEANTFPYIFGSDIAGDPAVQDRAHAIGVTTDGQYLFFAGHTSQTDAFGFTIEQLWVSKHDYCGKLLWVSHLEGTEPGRVFGGRGHRVQDLVVDEDRGEVAVVGWYSTLGAVWHTNIFTAGLSMADGAVNWVSTIDREEGDDQGLGITKDGVNLYITGVIQNGELIQNDDPRIASSTYRTQDAFVARLAPPNPTPVWVRAYNSPYVPPRQAVIDEGHDLIVRDGYLYATGAISRPVPGVVSYAKRSLWLSKIQTNNGDLVWSRYYDRGSRDGIAPRPWMETMGNRLVRAPDGFRVVGWEQGDSSGDRGAWPDIIEARFDPLGTFLSHEYWDGPDNTDTDEGFDIAMDSFGKRILTGALRIRHVISDFECGYEEGGYEMCPAVYVNSDRPWSYTYPPGDYTTRAQGRGIAIDGLGNIYVGAHLQRSPTSPTGVDFAIFKFTSNGPIDR